MTNPNKGHFAWFDLMTSDPGAAGVFYGELLGWTFKEMDMQGFTYTLFEAGGRGQGGIMPLEPASGLTSHWMSYIEVEQVDGACERAAQLGAKVCLEPRDIPGVGRFAILQDPSGALFSPFVSADAARQAEWLKEAPMPAVEGQISWCELVVTDAEAALSFYQQVVGWKAEPQEMGGGVVYHVLVPPGAQGPNSGVGGLMGMPDSKTSPPSWVPFVSVKDAEQIVARAQRLRGEVLHPLHAVPGVGRFAVLRDPTGGVFTVFESNRA
jgi:predicted enzyme related to lactoylglutathione lyase